MFESVEQLEKEVREFQQNILVSTEFVKKLDAIIAAIAAQERDFAAKSAEFTSKISSDTEAMRASQEKALKKLLDENKALIKQLEDTAHELEAQTKTQVETVATDHCELVQQLTERNRAISSEIGDKAASLISEIKAIPDKIRERNAALIVDVQRSVASVIETANSIFTAQKAQADALSAHCDGLLESMNTASKEHLAKTIDAISLTQKEYVSKIEEAEAQIKKCEADLSEKYDEFLKRLASTNVDQMFKLCQEIKQSVNTKLLVIMSGVGVSLILAVLSLFLR
jgi:hypothetical protein